MTDFVIHGVPGSPYVRTPLLVLEEKGLPWRIAAIGMGENRTPEYKARVHPFAKIPTLDHGDFRLYETRAIIDYIDQVSPEPPLTPAEPRLRARMNQIIGIVDSYVAARVSGAITFPRLIAPRFGMPTDNAAIAAAIEPAREAIDELARLLGDQAYVAGTELSLADLMLIPHLSYLPDFDEGMDLIGPHANLRRWMDRMTARPSFAATQWEKLAALSGQAVAA